MKKTYKLLSVILIVAMLVSLFCGCQPSEGSTGSTASAGVGELQDLAGQVKFDPNSGRASVETTVHLFVDGDTTHFNVPKEVNSTGILKARYLGVNTPESTGLIEPWGKKASEYTKNALSNATSIIIESDTASWNPDSTGERFLVWVWYKTAEMDDYRCLNLDILQEGLAVASKSSDTVYADACVAILNQAVTHKLYVHSKEKDPDFFYGSALPLTLKELKTNIESYTGKRVSFEGVVTRNVNKTAYVESYDEETGLYFGIQVFYGYNLDFFGEEVLTVGNRVKIVGSVQYYEAGGTYQISDIKYNSMLPDHEDNIQKLGDGEQAAYQTLTAQQLLKDQVELEVTIIDEAGEETLEMRTYDVGFLTMHSTASLKGLTIQDIYTTQKEDSSNNGAMSITCVDENGVQIVLRTVVLKDADGKTITADAFPIGSKLDAKGVVDVYDGVYQLKIFSASDLVLQDAA